MQTQRLQLGQVVVTGKCEGGGSDEVEEGQAIHFHLLQAVSVVDC
jgi:hypothetical protein